MADDKGKLEVALTLDASLDDIEDLPGFAVFPTGAYVITVPEVPEMKKIGEHPACEIKLQLDEVGEITDKLEGGEEPPKPGDICSLAFMMDNKFGTGALKEFVKPIAEHLGVKTLGEIFPQMKGMKLLVIIRRTYNKDKDQHYAKVKKVAIV